MKRISFIILCLLNTLSLLAQNLQLPPITFEDLSMEVYSKDSLADAVIMIKKGNALLYEDATSYNIRYHYAVRIKILKKSAYSLATTKINTYFDKSSNRLERVLDIHGQTYNIDNDVISTTELSKKDIFETRKDEHHYETSFTLPQVKEGSVIEYNYVVESPFPFRPNDWNFQEHIPVKYSEYEFWNPNNFAYRIIYQGISTMFDLNRAETSGNLNHYHWILKDIPALRNEPFMKNREDYIAKLHFELSEYIVPGMVAVKSFSRKWEDVDKELAQDEVYGLDSHIKRTGLWEEIAKEINSSTTDSLERIKKAQRFIRNNMAWNEHFNYTTGTKLKSVFEKKVGSSAEINLMLIGLLREMGFDANPVVLSTRANGLVWKDFPLLTRFNYLMGHLSFRGKDIFLDATNKLMTAGMIPAYCMNVEGRLIKGRNSRWIEINSSDKNTNITSSVLEINTDGTMKGQIQLTGNGYKNIEMKEEYAALEKDKFIEKLKKEHLTWKNPQFTFQNFEADSLYSPMITVETSIEDAYNASNDRIYLRPMMGHAIETNPLANPNRNLPVDFTYSKEDNHTLTFTMPDGYVPEEMPKGLKLTLPNDGGRFSYQVGRIDEHTIQVISKISFKRSVYPADEYTALRTFFAQIIAKQAEQIVLKKKTN